MVDETPTGIARRGLDVLLVEDNEGDAVLLQEALEEAAGHDWTVRVRRARTVAEAVAALSEAGPDCVLLDLGLPDATDELHALREVLRVRPTVAVVVVTGRADSELAASAVLSGAQDYLIKSADPSGEQLLRAVLFGARRARSVAALRASRDELALFAHRVAHDLRTPLTSVVGFADALLEDRVTDDGLRREMLERISEAGQAMSRMVAGMLRYAESAGGELERVRLDDVVAWVLPLVRGDLEAAGGQVEVGELHDARANEPALRTVLLNLVTNAVKYRAPERHLRIRIWSQRGPRGEEVDLLVQDNGVGIPPDQREAVFGFGMRLDSEVESAGVGLGLSAVRRIVEQLDGSVGFRDTPTGQGVRVQVRLQGVGQDDLSTERSHHRSR